MLRGFEVQDLTDGCKLAVGSDGGKPLCSGDLADCRRMFQIVFEWVAAKGVSPK